MHPILPAEHRGNDVIVELRVQPRASRNALRLHESGGLYMSVTAAPVDNAANEAVCSCLAGLLGIAQGRVTVVSGKRSRRKKLKIDGMSVSELVNKLAPILSTC